MAYCNTLVVVVVSMVVALTLAQNYGQPDYSQDQYHAPSYGGGGYGAPSYENYGPDNAQYYYSVQNYDPYLYKNAYWKVNRYPGGAAYQLQEEGKGSNVNVNVETHKAGGYGGGNGY